MCLERFNHKCLSLAMAKMGRTMNRAERRRAAKAAKKQAKTTGAERERILEKHWMRRWHFSDTGLSVRDKFNGREIAHYPGV